MNSRVSIFGGAPFLRFCLAFLAGIALSNYLTNLPFYFLTALYAFVLALIVVIKMLVKKSDKTIATSIFFGLFFLTLGAGYKILYSSERFKPNIPEQGYFTGTITEKSPAAKNRYKYEVKLDFAKSNDSIIATNETILVFISDSLNNQKLIPGNQITFSAKLITVTALYNPGEFDYQQFLKNNGIRYQAYVKSEIAIGPRLKNNLKTKALNIRSSLLKAYQKNGIKGDEFAVLAALTLGEKDFLTKRVLNSYVATGALHVLSVSGLHVGIIYLFLSYLLFPLGKSKRLKIVRFSILFSFLWFYAFITGLSPSVLRSCAMFSFILIGESIERKSNIYNSLATSAFMLVLLNPNYLFDVGFQLSYSALISIVYFQPKLASIYQPKNKLVKKLWDLLVVSIAAQIGTFPISVYYFHQFPVYFILSNYAVIPLSGIVLYGAFVFYLTMLIPFVSKIIALVLIGVLKTLNFSVQFIENLPGSLITDLWISRLTLLLLIVSIIAIAFHIKFRNPKTLLLSIFFMLILTINFSIESIKSSKQNILVFYNNYNEPLLSIISGKEHYYFSPSDTISSFSTTLLDNTSGYFRTKEAINFKTIHGKQSTIKQLDNCLFIKNIEVEIISGKRGENINPSNADIWWMPKYYKVFIKNKSGLVLKTIGMGKLVRFSETISTDGFKMKEQGALILYY